MFAHAFQPRFYERAGTGGAMDAVCTALTSAMNGGDSTPCTFSLSESPAMPLTYPRTEAPPSGITFGSVCSGIEAASVAFEALGWRAAWFSEIEPFPAAVLAHRFPAVQNVGDMTTMLARVEADELELELPDVLCGGCPCQAFSWAGKRESLDDDRGQLTLTFCEIADALDGARRSCGLPPTVVFYENVPGILSTNDNAFGCFLGRLSGEDGPLLPPGDKWANAGCVFGPARAIAWRVLDAQYFGVAQRRRRVFVVASARPGFDPTAVLFEFDGVRRDSAPSREAGEGAAGGAGDSAAVSGYSVEPLPFDTTQITSPLNQTRLCPDGPTGTLAKGAHPPAVAIPINSDASRANSEALTPCPDAEGRVRLRNPGLGVGGPSDPSFTLQSTQPHAVAVFPIDMRNATRSPDKHDAQNRQGCGLGEAGDPAATLNTAHVHGVVTAATVRRLTPVECARLQGFPDDWAQIPWKGKPADQCPDGPQYKAYGNSWAVPCARWIGRRIDRYLKESP